MARTRVPKGVLRPRDAVLRMAPYSPPSGNRAGKTRLDFNENTVGASPKVVEAIRSQVTAESLAIYPDYEAARAEFGKFLQVGPERFTFTNGTDEAIQLLVNTYVSAGDEVVTVKPSYAMYKFYAELAGAKVKEVPLRKADLSFPLEDVLPAITPATRAVLLANPNNPTGTLIDRASIERLLKRARRAAVLIDEAYYEFSGMTSLGLMQEWPNLFISRTFSKVYGLAAMRIGCLISRPENVAFLRKAQSPYSVNMTAILAAREAIRDQATLRGYVAEVLASRELLSVGLEKLKVPYYPSHGNFILMKIGKRAIEIRDKLREQNVLVRDRSYEIAGCVRVTVGTREQTRKFLSALEALL